MSKRIDKSWLVFASIENADHDRCIDIFRRPDMTFGFEEFRRDIEDSGAWTPTQYFSGRSFGACDDAYEAACRAVDWFDEQLKLTPSLKKYPSVAN